MTPEEVLAKKQRNDPRMIAEMTGRTTEAIRMAFVNKKGKTYEVAIQALEKIIEMREQLLNSK